MLSFQGAELLFQILTQIRIILTSSFKYKILPRKIPPGESQW